MVSYRHPNGYLVCKIPTAPCNSHPRFMDPLEVRPHGVIITIVYLTKGSLTEPMRQHGSCSPDRNDTEACVIKKVSTIRSGGVRFVVVKTACGERHMSIADWMMWKDKDAKWLSDSRSENKGASEGVSCAEESISDDGIAREEKEGQSSSSPMEKTPYSEPPLLLGV
jgi:hypothetical protein